MNSRSGAPRNPSGRKGGKKAAPVPPRILPKLLDASAQIRKREAVDAGELAFVARILAQCTLPHSDPGDVASFGRRAGALRLAVQPGIDVGLPYGSYPRLVMAWLTTEAVRTKSRKIVLGDSLSGFMRELGIVPTGGRWGTITRLRDQMRRLFSARIAATYDGDQGFALRSMEVATEADLWWTPKDPDQAAIWQSTVTLGERFFEAIVERPVPLDMRALRALKRSPLGLDLYAMIAYRVSYAKEPVAITWESLHAQLGADYSDMRFFAQKVKRELTKIRVVWPELHAETPRGRLVLHPSIPPITKRTLTDK